MKTEIKRQEIGLSLIKCLWIDSCLDYFIIYTFKDLIYCENYNKNKEKVSCQNNMIKENNYNIIRQIAVHIHYIVLDIIQNNNHCKDRF